MWWNKKGFGAVLFRERLPYISFGVISKGGGCLTTIDIDAYLRLHQVKYQKVISISENTYNMFALSVLIFYVLASICNYFHNKKNFFAVSSNFKILSRRIK